MYTDEYESTHGLATGLGWFSIGLGAAELLAPGALARMIGVHDSETSRRVLQFYGLRELSAGAGILSRDKPTGWMWGRVGGDLLDLATLLSASGPAASRQRKLMATAAVVGATVLDIVCAARLSQEEEALLDEGHEASSAREAITIDASPEEVYRFWRNFENLPRFMRHLESVTLAGERISHWRARGPAGMTVEWDAVLIEDEPNRLISWRSVENSDVSNAGTVRFERAPGGRGTVVHVDIHYSLPGGRAAASIARLFDMAPQQLIRNDLRRLKQIMELGEVVHSDASIHDRMHPARPPSRVPERALNTPEPVGI